MRFRSIALSLCAAIGTVSVTTVSRAEAIAASAATPPPTQGCGEIQLGPIYDVSAEPVGGIQCFQFATSETNSKLSLTVVAPTITDPYDVHLAKMGKDFPVPKMCAWCLAGPTQPAKSR